MSDVIVAEVQRIVFEAMEARGGPRPSDPVDAAATWDSYALVEIIFAIEDHYGFEMTSAEMERISEVEDLVAIVAQHRPDLAE